MSKFYILPPCAFDFDTPRFIRLPPLQRTAPWPQRGTEAPFEKLCARVSTLGIKHAPLQMDESKGVARNDKEVHETRKASSRLALIAAKVKGYINRLVADSSGPDLQNNYTDCNLYESHTGFVCKPALTDETVRSAQKQRDAVLPKQLGRFAQHRFALEIGDDDRGKSGEETRVSVDQLLDVFALHVGVKFLQHLGRYLDRESAIETLNKCFLTFGIPVSEILNNSDGFTQRPNRPWSRTPRNSFL